MTREIYQYSFDPSVAFEEVEASLVLALLATESLHGESQVRLDAAHAADPDRRTCAIDAATPVGKDLNRLFVGFLTREFGQEAFTVRSATTRRPSDDGKGGGGAGCAPEPSQN